MAGARPRIPFADAVDQDAHVHAARNRGGQGPAEVLPGLILIENVGGQADMVSCGLDGLEHGRVGLLAVEKRFHTVAADQGMPAQRPAATGQFGESLGQVLRQGVEAADRLSPLPRSQRRHRKALGPVARAVDAEEQVQHRPGHRGDHTHGDPAKRPARLPLVEQGVNRRRRCERSVEQQQDESLRAQFADLLGGPAAMIRGDRGGVWVGPKQHLV